MNSNKQHFSLNGLWIPHSKYQMSEEYEVEKIIDLKVQNGKQLFKVKWKGYSLSDCTWQPQENLTNCLMEIEQFKRKRKPSNLKQPMPFKQRFPSMTIDSPDEQSGEKEGKVPSTAKDANKFTYEEEASEQENQDNDHQKFFIQPKKMANPILVITKMLQDEQGNIFFEASLEDRVQTFSRSELIKSNLFQLLEFYERSVRIVPKNH